jgi:hypothetical protein
MRSFLGTHFLQDGMLGGDAVSLFLVFHSQQGDFCLFLPASEGRKEAMAAPLCEISPLSLVSSAGQTFLLCWEIIRGSE